MSSAKFGIKSVKTINAMSNDSSHSY